MGIDAMVTAEKTRKAKESQATNGLAATGATAELSSPHTHTKLTLKFFEDIRKKRSRGRI